MRPLTVRICAFDGCQRLTMRTLCERHRLAQSAFSTAERANRAREEREEREQRDPLFETAGADE